MLFSHSALVAPCLFHARLCLSSLLVSFLALLSNFATQLSVADRAHYINKMTWQPINVAPHVRSLSCATLLLAQCLPCLRCPPLFNCLIIFYAKWAICCRYKAHSVHFHCYYCAHRFHAALALAFSLFVSLTCALLLYLYAY